MKKSNMNKNSKRMVSRKTAMYLRRVRAVAILISLVVIAIKGFNYLGPVDRVSASEDLEVYEVASEIVISEEVAIEENNEVVSETAIEELSEVIYEESEEEIIKADSEISFDDTNEDYFNLRRILWTEAHLAWDNGWRDSTADEIRDVGAVILNRVASDQFPNTIKEVIFQENGRQFNGVRASTGWGNTSSLCDQVAKELLIDGSHLDSNVLWYHNPTGSTDTAHVEKMKPYLVFKSGGHHFFNNDGRF